jgi:hypothetical protein
MHVTPDDSPSFSSTAITHENSEFKRLCSLVAEARGRLAELEAGYTIEKAKADGLQARLFSLLREYHQERERLRLIVSYRKQFIEALLRKPDKKASNLQGEYYKARAHSDREYEETAATMADKQQLTNEEESELGRLWRKLVKLYHPDRFANEPNKMETYDKLTAAINHAKDSGDLETLRQIASDPHGFILRQGWGSLDFHEEEQITQLRKLLDSLEREIQNVTAAANLLHESPEFEFFELVAKKPEMLDSVVEKHTAILEAEISDLNSEAERLGQEIEELTGQTWPSGQSQAPMQSL